MSINPYDLRDIQISFFEEWREKIELRYVSASYAGKEPRLTVGVAETSLSAVPGYYRDVLVVAVEAEQAHALAEPAAHPAAADQTTELAR